MQDPLEERILSEIPPTHTHTHTYLIGVAWKHWFHWDPAMAPPWTTAPSAGMGVCRLSWAWVCFPRWGVSASCSGGGKGKRSDL